MRCVTAVLAAALGLGCANNSGAVIEADAALSDSNPVAVDTPAPQDRAAPDVSSALDVPALPATDVSVGDVPLFADGGRVPVCLPCTRNEDCGNDGACVAVAPGAPACLPPSNPDVPVFPGPLPRVRHPAPPSHPRSAPLCAPACISTTPAAQPAVEGASGAGRGGGGSRGGWGAGSRG